MYGWNGDDQYVVDNLGDQVYEWSGEGTDYVYTTVSFSLAGQDLEHLTLTGTGNIDGVGNALDNTITGNDGNNRLDGGAGNDTLSAAKATTPMWSDTGTDTVIEYAAQGYDIVWASVSYVIGNFVEELRSLDINALAGPDADRQQLYSVYRRRCGRQHDLWQWRAGLAVRRRRQ